MDDDIKQPAPPNMAWLLTFADLVSLLITFFVLLFSMKTVDESQWDVLKGEFIGVFSREASNVVVKPQDYSTTEVIASFPAESLPYLQNVLRVEFRRDAILSNMKSEYDTRADILRLTLPTKVLFEDGGDTLSRTGRVAVMKLADKLRHLDNRMQISAHTSPGRFRSKDIPTNWELTLLQAIAVVETMHSRGLNTDIPAVGYAESRFEADFSQLPLVERYQQARRLEIEIYGDQS